MFSTKWFALGCLCLFFVECALSIESSKSFSKKNSNNQRSKTGSNSRPKNMGKSVKHNKMKIDGHKGSSKFNSKVIDPVLQSYLSFTNVNSMTSFPALNRIAWVEASQGASNVYVAQGPNYNAESCTNFSEDLGIDITNLVFSDDGDRVYFTYGPYDSNNGADLSFALPTFLGVVPFNCMDVSLLDYAATPMTSGPLGVFTVLNSQQVAIFNSSTPDVIFQVGATQGYISDLSWSDEANALTFTSYRGDHSIVGVWNPDDPQHLEWINPTFDQNQLPMWSPDGTNLAYFRFYEVDQPNGNSFITQFEIWITDVSTGESYSVYSDDTVGYPVTYGFGVRQMQWVDDSTIIFPCESTGWLHVCSVDITDYTVNELITGDCEAQDFIPYGQYVYISNNCENIDTLVITQVDYTTLASNPVTSANINVVSGLASEGYGMAVLNDGVSFIQTTYNESGYIVVWEMEGNVRKISGENSAFDGRNFVIPQDVSFTSLDGLFTIHAQLFLPPNYDPSSKYPAVVFTHGGPMRQMYCAFHYDVDYARLYVLNQYFALNGFVVISVNYRLGVGYGKAFRDCDGCAQWGAKEYLDVLGGNKYLQNLQYVDETRIGIHGLSYGGLNCLQALARNSDLFAAGVANAPVFNWMSQLRFDGVEYYDYMPQLGPPYALPVGPEPNLAVPQWINYVNENQQIAYESSPVGHIANFTSPILVMQGDGDMNVDFQESMGLIAALRNKGGVVIESIMMPNEKHGFAVFSNVLVAYQATYNFLEYYLN